MKDAKRVECPRCAAAGRDVATLTVNSLVAPEMSADLGEGPYRFCATPGCEAVYYGEDGRTILKDLMAVRVGLKEAEAPRPVCYCFGYSVESIHDEIRRTGKSTAAADIGARIKAGLCACEVKNPEGVCCLGRVHRVVKDAMASGGAATASAPGAASELTGGGVAHCCAPEPGARSSAGSPEPKRGGVWALGAASASAILASACCWLPLVLVSLGASAAGVSAVFASLRPALLVVTACFLGAGFYYAYAPANRCTPGSACAVPDPRDRRRKRTLLWLATLFVGAMALFPLYAAWLAGGGSAHAADAMDAVVVRMTVSGMHCPACATGVAKELRKVPGVLEADVDYGAKEATVKIRRGAPVDDSALEAAVASAGYQASKIIPGRTHS